MSNVTITLTDAEVETLKAVLAATRQSQTVRSMLETVKSVTTAKPVRCYHCSQSWDAKTVTVKMVATHLAAVHQYTRSDASDNAQNTAWGLVHDRTLCTIVGVHEH